MMGILAWALNLLRRDGWSSSRVFMHNVVQHGVRRGKFLDICIQERRNRRCLYRSTLIIGEKFQEYLPSCFRGLKGIYGG